MPETWDAMMSVEQYCEQQADIFRKDLAALEQRARDFVNETKPMGNSEVIAQATLAMRHIEDARMKYWKVIQYTKGWASIYDQPKNQESAPEESKPE